MSIASEITRLQTAKANIKTSIENKGVVVSSSDKLDDYSILIDSINISTQIKTVNPQNYTREITPDVGYRGLSKVVLDGVLVDAHDSYTSTTDDDVAYEKIVPSGALKYATLDMLGGMSYKCNNLCPTATYDGVMNNTFEKSIDLGNLPNGTYTISFNVLANADNRTFIIYYVDNGVVNTTDIINTNLNGTGQKSYTFTISNSITYDDIIFGINSGSNNYAIQLENLMLVKGSTAPTEFQPYFTDIRDSVITSVKSYGANLLNISDVAETTRNGITYKVENQTLYMNGTATSGFAIDLITSISIANTNGLVLAFWSNNTPSGAFEIDCKSGTNNYYMQLKSILSTSTSGSTSKVSDNAIIDSVFLWIPSGITFTNYIVKPMLVKGSTAPTTYHSYRGLIETKTIPAEVQALSGYGWGINDTCYNYIYFDTTRKKWFYVQKVGRVDLGTINWNYNSTRNFFTYDTLDYKLTTNVPSISSIYEYKGTVTSAQDAQYLLSNMQYCLYYKSDNLVPYLYFKNTAYTNAKAFKTAMNGVYLYYELATPVETDISQYLNDNTIEVEENGTLVSNNTYEQKVPSEITYLVEV